MGSINIALDTAKVDTTLVVKAGQPRENLQRIIHELNGMIGGASKSTATITQNTTNFATASQTVTCTQADFTTGDILTIIGVNLTEGTDFDADTDDATTATNIAAAINANATLTKFFDAAAATNVVTITCLIPGEIINYLDPTTVTVNAGTPMTLSNSGAFTGGTGGSNGTAITFPG